MDTSWNAPSRRSVILAGVAMVALPVLPRSVKASVEPAVRFKVKKWPASEFPHDWIAAKRRAPGHLSLRILSSGGEIVAVEEVRTATPFGSGYSRLEL